MTLTGLDNALQKELTRLTTEGLAKTQERIITGYIPPEKGRGPRCTIEGEAGTFLKMNSNSYLCLTNHPKLVAAADAATRQCGVGPGSVRFIDGTYTYHVELEKRIAQFVAKPAAKIFNSAYTANCGLALSISNSTTMWIGDQLNHNSIIRAMRIAGVPKNNKAIYRHNDLDDLQRCLEKIDKTITRVIVVFDGIFSMRGDYAPIDEIIAVTKNFENRFDDGVITVVDDSHGIGAYGATGRGTPEFTNGDPDIIVGTFGKAFGVNGGFIAASETVIEKVRQTADTYIYTNPLSVADCSAATMALNICDSDEGQNLLAVLQERTKQFRKGLENLQVESVSGPHPIVPLMVRDTARTHDLVKSLFNSGILVVGLTYPVVPLGDEGIRFQINSGHTEKDIDETLQAVSEVL